MFNLFKKAVEEDNIEDIEEKKWQEDEEERQHEDAVSYFNLGHGDNSDNDEVWIFLDGKLWSELESEFGSHANFGTVEVLAPNGKDTFNDRLSDWNWRGRYDYDTNTVSVVPPAYKYKSHRNTEIPAGLISAITRRWGKVDIEPFAGAVYYPIIEAETQTPTFEQSMIDAEKYKNDKKNLWDISGVSQAISSGDTSINKSKLPRAYSLGVKNSLFNPGDKVIDIGGGRYDNAIEFGKNNGFTVGVYDVFNRAEDYNENTVNKFSHGQSDVAVISNVLNVVMESQNQMRILHQAYNALRPGGKAIITVYYDSKMPRGGRRTSSDSWQWNMPLSAYLPMVEMVFPVCQIKNNSIIAYKDGPKIAKSFNLYKKASVDDAYFQAINEGRLDDAQKMVDAAASAAGYNANNGNGFWHGSKENYNAFDLNKVSPYFSGDRMKFYFAYNKEKAESHGNAKKYYLKLTKEGQYDENDTLYPKDADYVDLHGLQISVRYPEQIKLGNAIVRDDSGEIVPLSKRFNSGSNDVRAKNKFNLLKKAWHDEDFDDEEPSYIALGHNPPGLMGGGSFNNELWLYDDFEDDESRRFQVVKEYDDSKQKAPKTHSNVWGMQTEDVSWKGRVDHDNKQISIIPPSIDSGSKVPKAILTALKDDFFRSKYQIVYFECHAKSFNWLKKANSYSKDLEGLAAEARKCNTFEEFENNFLGQIKHGRYYHITDDPNFQIDPQKGPRDMSSLAMGEMDIGSLMVTSDLPTWVEEYPDRKFVAIIDMSNVPASDYYQVKRGFGNEFFVKDPSQARVEKVIPLEQALEEDGNYDALKPASQEALKEFYERVKNQS